MMACASLGLTQADLPDSAQLSCSGATATSLTVSWKLVPETDLYYIAILNKTAEFEEILALNTVPPNKQSATLDNLRPDTSYLLRLRSHPSSAPSTVWGWRNASGP